MDESKFLKNIPLKDYVTFKIGGPAKYFLVAKTKEELILAIKFAKEKKIPFFILGNGSNLLVQDKGFNGLIIKNEINDLEVDGNVIRASSGVLLSALVFEARRNELGGVEWCSAIPGTVGGAVWANAGAFGCSFGDEIKSVEVLDTNDLTVKAFSKKDCRFNYRTSIFKEQKNLIVLSAEFSLNKKDKKEIEEEIKIYLEKRKNRQPLDFPSAGSIFRNPEGMNAGELIEKCGLKGKQIGNVKVSERHANFIINLGNGKCKDVLKLIALIEKEVKKKFKIKLEKEIVILN